MFRVPLVFLGDEASGNELRSGAVPFREPPGPLYQTRFNLNSVGLESQPAGHDRNHAQTRAPLEHGHDTTAQAGQFMIDPLVIRGHVTSKFRPRLKSLPDPIRLDPELLHPWQ